DSFDGRRSGAIDVPRAARLGNFGDQSERNFFRAHGGTHHGIAAGAGAEFSGLRAPAGPRALVTAGVVGQAAAFDGTERAGVADCGLWFNRARSGETREGLRNARVWSNTVRGRRPLIGRKNFRRNKIARSVAVSGLGGDFRAGDRRDKAFDRSGGDREDEARSALDSERTRGVTGRRS